MVACYLCQLNLFITVILGNHRLPKSRKRNLLLGESERNKKSISEEIGARKWHFVIFRNNFCITEIRILHNSDILVLIATSTIAIATATDVKESEQLLFSFEKFRDLQGQKLTKQKEQIRKK